MKKYIIALIITILFLSSPAHALYRVTDFTGGCADCADAIDGARFNAKTKPVYVIVTTTPEHATYPSKGFAYLWDSDAGCSEVVPDSIIPDTNASGGCLMLLTPGQAADIVADSVKDTHIDWGTGTDQVSAVDVPIADGGSLITGTEVETALQENRGLVNTNTTAIGLNTTAVATSAGLAGSLSDETGSGAAVFGTGPTISAPVITDGAEISGDLTVTGQATFDPVESLSNTGLTGGTSWSETGDFALTSDTAVYTDSTGVGELIQAAGDMALPVVGNVSYEVTYTLSTVSGNGRAYIEATNGLVDTDIVLWETSSPIAGTWTKRFTTKASPADFRISVTSTTGAFTLDDVQLKRSVVTVTGQSFFIGDAREKIYVSDASDMIKRVTINTIDNPTGGDDYWTMMVEENLTSSVAMMPLIVLSGMNKEDMDVWPNYVHSGGVAVISAVSHPNSTAGHASTVIKNYTGGTIENSVNTAYFGIFELQKGDMDLNGDYPVSGVRGEVITAGADTKSFTEAAGVMGRIRLDGTNDTCEFCASVWAMDNRGDTMTKSIGVYVASQTGGVDNYGIILDGYNSETGIHYGDGQESSIEYIVGTILTTPVCDATCATNNEFDTVNSFVDGDVVISTISEAGMIATEALAICASGNTGANTFGLDTDLSCGGDCTTCNSSKDLTAEASPIGKLTVIDVEQGLSIKSPSTIAFNSINSNVSVYDSGGSGAQGHSPLYTTLNRVVTVPNANDAVTFPEAQFGKLMSVVNDSTNALLVFPASGDKIGDNANDASISLAGNSKLDCWATNNNVWFCSENVLK